MAEAKGDQPVPISEEEHEATLAAIDRGIRAAEEGRVVSLEEARQRLQKWLQSQKNDHLGSESL